MTNNVINLRLKIQMYLQLVAAWAGHVSHSLSLSLSLRVLMIILMTLSSKKQTKRATDQGQCPMLMMFRW